MLLQGRRILYIEDDPRNRRLVELLLGAAGAQVRVERWGVPAMALSAVAEHLPLDLILLDLMFSSGFSGYDVFRTLRQQAGLDTVPIVMVSAAEAGLEMPRARQAGLSGYVAKPIDALLFPQQVLDAIKGQPVWYAPH